MQIVPSPSNSPAAYATSDRDGLFILFPLLRRATSALEEIDNTVGNRNCFFVQLRIAGRFWTFLARKLQKMKKDFASTLPHIAFIH
jgi:hypothetical protein